MIKSSDQNFDNTYHILKVLANRDYLALDHTHSHFIFGELHSRSTSPHQTQQLVFIDRGSNQHIIHSRECIVVEHNSYQVFEVGHNPPVWAKDIHQKKMASSKFITTLMRDAICNILAEFVWLNSNHSHRYVSVRNFWLIDGRIRLIMMPRFDQDPMIQKTERQRSYSQQTSKLTQLVDQNMMLIKQFASILWQVLQPCFAIRHYDQRATQKIKTLLQKMLNKQLSIDEIIQEVKELQSTSVSVDLRANRSFGLSNFNKSKLASRRHTLQPSMYGNSMQKNYRSAEKGTNQQYTYTGLKLQSRCKTQQVRQNQTPRPVPKTFNDIIFKWQPSGQKNKWYLNLRVKSYVQSSSSDCKLNRDVTPQRKITFTHNERERTKYLNWMRDRKMNTIQQVTRLSTIARQKFKESIKNHLPQTNLMDSSQLAEKLFSKALKFRSQKYRTIAHETEKNNTPEKMINTNQVNNILRQSQREKIMLQLQSKILSDDPIEKEPLSDGIPPKLKFKQQQKSFDFFPTDKAQVSNEKCYNWKQQTTKVINHPPFEKPSIHVVDNQQIQQLQSYQFSSRSAALTSKKSQAAEQKEPKLDYESSWAQAKSNIAGQKMNRIKMTKSDISNKDEDQIETIDLTFKEFKRTPKHLSREAIQYKQQQLREEPIPEIAHRKREQAPKENAGTEAIAKVVTEAVTQFLTLINILGDISIKCVHAKKHLGNYDWRKSVFFLYQRFYYQRNNLLEQLASNRFEIVRKHQNITNQHLQIWYSSNEKNPILETLKKENVKIAATYQQFSKKTLEECGFQPMIQNFIKNRAKILAKRDENIRGFISKYAIALIINEYDTAMQRKEASQEIRLYISRCLFALRVIAELDNRPAGREKVKLAEYVNLKVELEGEGDWVERLYQAYYPQDEKV